MYCGRVNSSVIFIDKIFSFLILKGNDYGYKWRNKNDTNDRQMLKKY